MEHPAACRLCGAVQLWRPIEHLVSPDTDLYLCDSCDGQFWWPVTNPGADWYEATYAGRNDDPVQRLGWNHYQFLGEPIATGTLLDVGAGIGHLMAAARDCGWSVSGLDFDRDSIGAAARAYGISTIEPLSMEQYAAANPGRTFDAVTAFEVLEHMDDPASFIRDMRTLVASGGHVAISVPYRNAPAWIRPHDFPPRHLTRWNRTAMKNFLTQNGFAVIHLRRGSVTLERLLMRIKFAAGPLGSMGALAAAKANMGTGAPTPGQAARLRWLRRAARLKDWALFGLPALAYWVYLWVQRRHYTALYVFAQRTT